MPFDTLTVRDAEIRVWSQGDGPPLCYLHGFETHPGEVGFLQRLAEDHRVLAPEQPGYGESTGFDQIDDTLDLVLVYRQLIESWTAQIGEDRVDLIGHSLGGMIAAEFAALCPQLVRRLVLVDPFGLWLDEEPLVDPFVLNADELKQAKWHDPDAAPDPEPSIYVPEPGDTTGPILERAKNLSAATKFLWPLPDRGLRKRLPLIQAPTLIVHGQSDGLVSTSYAERFAALVPGAAIAVIPEAGHLPMIEREDAFLDAVRPFLAG